MRTHYIVTTAFILFMASFLNAQTPGKTTVTTRPSATTGDPSLESIGFEFEVSLTPLGLAGIIVRRKSGLGLFTPSMLNSFANHLYNEQPGRSTGSRNSQNPSFVIRPDKDSRMEEILDAVNAMRVSPKTEIRIEIDSNLAVFIPKRLDPKGVPARPNPLFLLVKIDERSNILLNNEQKGSFPDTSKLEQHLRQIFKERAETGTWREGTTTTETTVLIRLDKKMTFTNFVELGRALGRAGADTIGLHVD